MLHERSSNRDLSGFHSPLSRRLSISPSRSVAGSAASAVGGYKESQLVEQICAFVASFAVPWVAHTDPLTPDSSNILDSSLLHSPRSEGVQQVVADELLTPVDSLSASTLYQDVIVGSMDLLCSGPGSAYSHPFTDSVDVDTDAFTTEVCVVVTSV